jgi:hypothetical protein
MIVPGSALLGVPAENLFDAQREQSRDLQCEGQARIVLLGLDRVHRLTRHEIDRLSSELDTWFASIARPYG